MLKGCVVAVLVPTLNAAQDWCRFSRALLSQQVAPDQVLVIDSGSADGTPRLARQTGFRVEEISPTEFNHGRTRQWGAQFFPDAEVFVYLTQDAVLANPDAVQKLLSAFKDPLVAAAFGRQLPRLKAGPIEAHARLFNYPAQSSVCSLASREEIGFKAVFLSNSFAAYRRVALEAVGGFPTNVVLGEDTITAARLLLNGFKIAYVADAQAYHSHEYSWIQEFARYFDIGVLHARESWLLREFGKTNGEGLRFVKSELAYLWTRNAALIPSALIRTALKFAGYHIGHIEDRLSIPLKRRLSMHDHYWSE